VGELEKQLLPFVTGIHLFYPHRHQSKQKGSLTGSLSVFDLFSENQP